MRLGDYGMEPEKWATPEPPKPVPPSTREEAVDIAVSALMNATQPWTRSEYRALIEEVFNAGVTSVVHERHG